MTLDEARADHWFIATSDLRHSQLDQNASTDTTFTRTRPRTACKAERQRDAFDARWGKKILGYGVKVFRPPDSPRSVVMCLGRGPDPDGASRATGARAARAGAHKCARLDL